MVNDVNWVSYKDWLLRKELNKAYSKDIMLYSKKYCGLLLTGNLSSIEGLKAEHHIMASLANLSKFLGMYDIWKDLRVQHGLKWKVTVSSDNAFLRLYSGKEETSHIEEWILEAKEKLPYDYYFPIAYCALTGLREVEMIMSLKKVVIEGLESYPLNNEIQVLEHFKDPKFLRHNKKAYISVVDPILLDHLKDWKSEITYWKLRAKVRREGLTCELRNLRKWYASILRMNKVSSESIDLLQGRIPQEVFVRSYLRYDIKKLCNRVRSVIKNYENVWLET